MKKNLLSLIFVGCRLIASAQMQGPNNPSAATESVFACLSCPGADWSNMMNVYANDNVNAITQMSGFPNCFQSSCFYTRDLEASSFGFTIPLSTTINGIMAEVKKNSLSGTSSFPIRDSLVQLMTSVGTNVGANRASAAPWSGTSTYSTYGGSSDLWGSTWTPAVINSTGFGLAFKARNTVATGQAANVDHIRITVFYTNTSIGINEIQSQSSDIIVFPNPSNESISVTCSGEPAESITVVDILGNRISRNQYASAITTHEIDMRDAARGIYFVEIKTKTGTTIKKFVRE